MKKTKLTAVLCSVFFIAMQFVGCLSFADDIPESSNRVRGVYNETEGGIADFNSDTTDGPASQQNPLTETLCQIIDFTQGRIGRAISIAAIFSMGIMFFLGKVTWPAIATLGVGLGLLFGAKLFALLILPSTVNVAKDNSGTEFVSRSTAQVIEEACPEL